MPHSFPENENCDAGALYQGTTLVVPSRAPSIIGPRREAPMAVWFFGVPLGSRRIALCLSPKPKTAIGASRLGPILLERGDGTTKVVPWSFYIFRRICLDSIGLARGPSTPV
jgi:hypothetical protein